MRLIRCQKYLIKGIVVIFSIIFTLYIITFFIVFDDRNYWLMNSNGLF